MISRVYRLLDTSQDLFLYKSAKARYVPIAKVSIGNREWYKSLSSGSIYSTLVVISKCEKAMTYYAAARHIHRYQSIVDRRSSTDE